MACIAIRYAEQQADSVKELGKKALRTITQIAERQSENVQGPFKAQLRAFATMLLNGPQKSKQSEKETPC